MDVGKFILYLEICKWFLSNTDCQAKQQKDQFQFSNVWIKYCHILDTLCLSEGLSKRLPRALILQGVNRYSLKEGFCSYVDREILD